MSLPIDDVLDILRQHLPKDDPNLLQAVAKDLLQAEREAKAANASDAPKAKTRLAIVMRGDEALQRAVTQGGYIVAVPDGDEDPTTSTYMGDGLRDRLIKAAKQHNEAPKGRRGKSKRKIETLHDAMTILTSKTLKASGSQITIKQKGVPAEIVVFTKEQILA